MTNFTTFYIAKRINGKLIGKDEPVDGVFTFLNNAEPGDVVIRHWIDEDGVKIASKKDIVCLVTQNPRGNSIEIAEKLGLNLIITPKIELANAFALKWAIEKFGKNSVRVAVTGTNGKSTTAHMIYSILKHAGYNTYTNTDAKSEFNTLIDPVISRQIHEFELNSGKIDAMVIEVSEVQGWMDKLMKDHASLMVGAIEPHVLVLTNVSLDHIGLVNSIEETYNEIEGSLKALSSISHEHNSNSFYAVLNSDDELLMKMSESVAGDDGLKFIFFGGDDGVDDSLVSLKSNGIHVQNELFLKTDVLPFKSWHFIQNTMAAIGACLTLNIDHEIIKEGVSQYKPLERRFTVIDNDPTIIDDFAHNPEGISATVKSAAEMCEGKLRIIFAIRGSRGETINRLNVEAVVEGLNGVNYALTITSSVEEVDSLNTVLPNEKEVVLDTLKENGLKFNFYEKLHDALDNGISSAVEEDIILLIGAQGMDPASEIIRKDFNKDKT